MLRSHSAVRGHRVPAGARRPTARPAATALLATLALLGVACSSGAAEEVAPSTTADSPASTTATTTTTTTSTTTTTTTLVPRFALGGRVLGVGGTPLRDAVVTVGEEEIVTGADGFFEFAPIPAAPIEIARPAYHPRVIEWDGTEAAVAVTLEPVVARGLRAASGSAGDDEAFAALLDLAAATAVDALVFDTKKEGGNVLYDTAVAEAHDIGAVAAVYDPAERIEQARAAGLYTITRIVSFEDPIRVAARPESKLAGRWIDMTDPDNWEYPLDLAVEACELGFDEIQFDYVRFPSGQAAAQARRTHPTTGDERVAAIAAFLTEARDRLHPLGCAVAADVFAIVFSAPDDQGIGQRPEDFSGLVDVLSPMIYPSHYSDGWLGFPDPNDYPGEVTAGALDDGMPRVGSGTIVRPWLQAFSWTDAEILEAISAAERRGVGWMLWHSGGRYDLESLPLVPPQQSS